MARAEYEYVPFGVGYGAVFIRDLNRGKMSVTNDVEAVVKEVNQLHPGKRIVYSDSDGEPGELLHDNGVFRDYEVYNGPSPF